MKDFQLDENHDILIQTCDIPYVSGKQQEIQKIQQVLGTKLGEWKYNSNEGLDFDALLQKHPDQNRIREAVQNALFEIDENYVLQECSYSVEDKVIQIKASAESTTPVELYVEV